MYGRKIQQELDVLPLLAGIAVTVISGKGNLVSAVPEQTLLARLQVQSHIDLAAFQRQGNHGRLGPLVTRLRRPLFLRGSPGGADLVSQNDPRVVGADENRTRQNQPGDGSAYVDKRDGGDSFDHTGTIERSTHHCQVL